MKHWFWFQTLFIFCHTLPWHDKLINVLSFRIVIPHHFFNPLVSLILRNTVFLSFYNPQLKCLPIMMHEKSFLQSHFLDCSSSAWCQDLFSVKEPWFEVTSSRQAVVSVFSMGRYNDIKAGNIIIIIIHYDERFIFTLSQFRKVTPPSSLLLGGGRKLAYFPRRKRNLSHVLNWDTLIFVVSFCLQLPAVSQKKDGWFPFKQHCPLLGSESALWLKSARTTTEIY